MKTVLYLEENYRAIKNHPYFPPPPPAAIIAEHSCLVLASSAIIFVHETKAKSSYFTPPSRTRMSAFLTLKVKTEVNDIN